MSTVTRKFTIEALLSRMPYKEKRQALKDLEMILTLSTSQLWRIRNAQHGDSTSLRHDQLLKLAKYFNVPVEDLITESEKANV